METRRHRWLYTVGAAAACAAVIIGGTVAANAAIDRGDGSDSPGVEFAAAPPASAPPSTPPSRDAEPEENRTPLGKPVDLGLRDYVLYAVPVDLAELPKTTFGVMLGRRLPDGTLTADVVSNETVGADRAPGFHAVQAGTDDAMPTFGYYVGPATKITAKAGGRTVTAKRAAWSEDPRVVFFWFAPADQQLTGLTAYDKSGRKLATGNSGVGVG
jgi:hypothetical protein